VFLRSLALHEYRSYESAQLTFGDGPTVLVGPNGQGKTNVLEAIQRISTGSSHRASSDQPLIRHGTPSGVLRAHIETDEGRTRSVELQLGVGRRTRVDGNDVRRSSEAVGVLRSVLFAPEDTAIVRGDPSERRRFLDELLVLRRPAYGGVRSDFERVLRQRNNLLKSARPLRGEARVEALRTLEAWTEQFVGHAATVTAARIASVHALAPRVDEIYRNLADRPEPVALTYATAAGFDVVGVTDGGTPDVAGLATLLREALARTAKDEQDRGLTLVGPHRDELVLDLGALPARGYASHGEGWSLALALKLATYDVVAEVGDRPIVLLDDVFAELDTRRRAQLAEACQDWDQVIVTAAVEADVPVAGARVDVHLDGGVSQAIARPEPIRPEPVRLEQAP
jgi:DNA replication and repair protein RecF